MEGLDDMSKRIQELMDMYEKLCALLMDSVDETTEYIDEIKHNIQYIIEICEECLKDVSRIRDAAYCIEFESVRKDYELYAEHYITITDFMYDFVERTKKVQGEYTENPLGFEKWKCGFCKDKENFIMHCKETIDCIDSWKAYEESLTTEYIYGSPEFMAEKLYQEAKSLRQF